MVYGCLPGRAILSCKVFEFFRVANLSWVLLGDIRGKVDFFELAGEGFAFSGYQLQMSETVDSEDGCGDLFFVIDIFGFDAKLHQLRKVFGVEAVGVVP